MTEEEYYDSLAVVWNERYREYLQTKRKINLFLSKQKACECQRMFEPSANEYLSHLC